MEVPYVLLAINAVIGIASFFGGMVIRDLSAAVKELRDADTAMLNRLANYSTKDEVREIRQEQRDTLREMRDEQRENFNLVFSKLDAVTQALASKADRHEFPVSRFPG